MANVNPISGVPFGQEKTNAARLARAAWELEQASKIRASRKPVGWEHLVAAHEKTARAYEALARKTEERPQRAHATMKAPSASQPTGTMYIPTDAGKFIADYVRKDREHLGVELRAACQKPKKSRERDLREIAWAAVDNINHAWEGRLGLITRGDITDAVEHLQRWCEKQGAATKRHGGKR